MTSRLGLLTFVLAMTCLSAYGMLQKPQPTSQPQAATAGVKPVSSRPVSQPTSRAASSAASAPASEPADTRPVIAHIRLDGQVLESPPNFSFLSESTANVTLREWLQRLARARNDKSVSAVAMVIDSPEMTWAQAEELADAVSRLNQVKPVYTFLVDGGTLDYLVASAGQQVSMDPGGSLMMMGLGGEILFYRGTLDWLGIQPQMIQCGRFKGAAEPFAQTQPSKELREEYNWIFDDLYALLCQSVGKNRGLGEEEVRKIIDVGPFSADDALKHKLVDSLVQQSDWENHVGLAVAGEDNDYVWKQDYGARQHANLDTGNPFAMMSMILRGGPKEEIRDPSIAIVHVNGMIVSGASDDGLFGDHLVGADTIAESLDEMGDDDRVKAVILRIDSPGGSAVASELIYQAVLRCAEKKPVIASIGSIGASGGYYIALAADEIYADPSAITGSVGVISGKLALTGLFKKVGISSWEITRGKNAGIHLNRAWTPDEETAMRRLAEKTYKLFVDHVRENRGDLIENIDDVTQGRIFTGRQAAENGLIDEVGGLRDVLREAQDLASITQPPGIISLPRPRTLLDVLRGDSQGVVAPSPRGESAAMTALIPPALLRRAGVSHLMNMTNLLQRESVLTVLPYFLTVRP
jgi:protease-4